MSQNRIGQGGNYVSGNDLIRMRKGRKLYAIVSFSCYMFNGAEAQFGWEMCSDRLFGFDNLAHHASDMIAVWGDWVKGKPVPFDKTLRRRLPPSTNDSPRIGSPVTPNVFGDPI